MKIVRTNSYLIKPNKEQKELINNIFKNTSIVRNQYVDDITNGVCMKRLAKEILLEYKDKYPELRKTDNSALMNTLFQLSDVNPKNIKKKKVKNTYTTSYLMYGDSFYLFDGFIYLPKVGNVKIKIYREIPKNGSIISATISRDKANTYYAKIIYEYYRENINKEIDMNKIIGLDYSSTFFYVDSEGTKANIPQFYRRQEEKISKLQAKLRKQKYGSKNYFETKRRLSIANKKIRNQRNDWLHKSSNEVVKKYDVICLENLDMKEIAHNNSLAKATYDNAYGLFQKMLVYKANYEGKKIVYVSKWFPSSKQCSVCGHINKNITLNDRVWKCKECGAYHDRDVNAAINIKNEGKRILLAKG